MNDLLFEYLNVFCQVYLDDILIYNKTRKEHEEHLHKIELKLVDVDLQIDIEKCEFFKIEVIFLEVILFTKRLRMNSKKIESIVN